MSTTAATLSLVQHVYNAIAEEMGAALARTAYSPNIKERQDFSCALFDAQGRLLAQAAHIPVHLGAMPRSVEAARRAFPEMGEGDLVLLNDPFEGGTHLPDLTMVSPVLCDGIRIGYTATRAHHADVGGMTPGSLPHSRSIFQEGLRIPPVRLIRGGELQEDVLRILCANSRNPSERRGDVRAQVNAHLLGTRRWKETRERYGAEMLEGIHDDLFAYADRCMRQAIAELPSGVWRAETFLENAEGSGPEAALRAALTVEGDNVEVDFRESGDAVAGSLNAVRAITEAAVAYVFLCWMCRRDPANPPPVNAGSLEAVSILTRPGSVVDATYPSAVAGGNVETSQRLVDLLLSLLGQAAPEQVPAQSQGTMNNITFGGTDAAGNGFAYYETVGGGSGAGNGTPGRCAVQCHMTNTLNTPVEALEYAYPLRVRELSIRRGSGGAGAWCGGDGMVREWEALRPMTLTLLTERRGEGPAGHCGGAAGEPGKQLRIREGVTCPLPAKGSAELMAGDRVRLETPGGGGFGSRPPELSFKS